MKVSGEACFFSLSERSRFVFARNPISLLPEMQLQQHHFHFPPVANICVLQKSVKKV